MPSETAAIKKSSITLYDMVIVGVMAAICFVVTYFIKIEIPTPAGPVMLKLANAFCLLAGILFGGIRGGLAAGIGSMLYDLLDPKYMIDAPLTFVRFFLMAFLCGIICFSKNHKGEHLGFTITGAAAGSIFSLVFYFAQSLIKQLIQSQPVDVALMNILPKMITSSINAVAAVIIACLIAPVCHIALKKAGVYQKLKIGKRKGS